MLGGKYVDKQVNLGRKSQDLRGLTPLNMSTGEILRNVCYN